MITSGCERTGCILRAVIECNLMAGRSKPKGSFSPELWPPIDKVQLPDFDHPCYQFAWWRAFLQHKVDRDVSLKGRSVVRCKGLGGMPGPGQSSVVSQCVRLLVGHRSQRVPSDPGQPWGDVLGRITSWTALLMGESIKFSYIFPISYYPSWCVAA